jgi:hypothetical protein
MTTEIRLTHALSADAWGAPVTTEEHAARCAYMTEWLSAHEGDDLSITVRPTRQGEVEGCRIRGEGPDVRRGSRIEDASEGRVTEAQLADLLGRAWAAACQISATDDDVRALGAEADAARLDVERAIDRSDSHTEVVTLEYSDARAEALLAASDDSVDAGRVVEFWGTSEAGDEWRVHLRRTTNA